MVKNEIIRKIALKSGVKQRGMTNSSFCTKSPKYETFARKEPQKQNSIPDSLDLKRALENGSSEIKLFYLLHPISEHMFSMDFHFLLHFHHS